MADATGARSRPPEYSSRPAQVDREPGSRLGQALLLVNEIDRTARLLRPILRTVKRLTGLSPAQVHALLAAAEDGEVDRGPRDDGAIRPALAGTGLITADATTAEGPDGAGSRLTDSGRAALEQIQGLQIRILDTVMTSLPEREVDEILASLRRIGDSLEGMPPHPEPWPSTGTGTA
ncbi:hypothetical protein [Actinotalea ferrariae]|nr:hypothetical protein [Actinotalea ferrariae]